MKNIIDKIIKREGSYTYDTGGPTKYGITIPSLNDFYLNMFDITKKDIENLTEEDAKEFYQWLFIKNKLNFIKNDNLIDLIFDSIVNHGTDRTVKWVQGICNIKIDGIIGNITLGAINNNSNYIYYKLLYKRIDFYTNLIINNKDKYFIYYRGWINRLEDFIINI